MYILIHVHVCVCFQYKEFDILLGFDAFRSQTEVTDYLQTIIHLYDYIAFDYIAFDYN